MPPYTREVFNRIADRIEALFANDENLPVLFLSGVSLSFAIALMLAVWQPVGDTAGIVFGRLQFDPSKHVPEFVNGGKTFVERALLGVLAFEAALSSGIMSLHLVYGLAASDARTRVLAAFSLAGRPLLTIRDGRLRAEDKTHPINLVGGPGIVNVASNTAIVTEKNGSHCRVIGPGEHILGRFERIFALVDLRPQLVNRQVKTQTKDGIPVQGSGEIEFMIMPADARPRVSLPWGRLLLRAFLEWVAIFLWLIGRPEQAQRVLRNIERRDPYTPEPRGMQRPPYPFSARNIIRAVYGQRIARKQTGEASPVVWSEIIPEVAAGELRNALSTLTLDRLTEPEDTPTDATLNRTDTPRWAIQNQILRNVAGRVRAWGCVPLRFSLGRVALDPDQVDEDLRQRVESQRANTWCAEWTRRAQLVEGATTAEVNRLRETARAEAQAQMIRAIVSGLPIDGDPTTVRRLVLLRVLTAMEELRLDPRAQRFIPSEAIRVLELLRQVTA